MSDSWDPDELDLFEASSPRFSTTWAWRWWCETTSCMATCTGATFCIPCPTTMLRCWIVALPHLWTRGLSLPSVPSSGHWLWSPWSNLAEVVDSLMIEWWRWMEMDGDGWRWMDMDGYGWIWMDMDGYGWIWQNHRDQIQTNGTHDIFQTCCKFANFTSVRTWGVFLHALCSGQTDTVVEYLQRFNEANLDAWFL